MKHIDLECIHIECMYINNNNNIQHSAHHQLGSHLICKILDIVTTKDTIFVLKFKPRTALNLANKIFLVNSQPTTQP